MAIQIDLSSDAVGVEVPAAYARICDYTGNKTTIAYLVDIYASLAAKTAGKPALKRAMFRMDATGVVGNFNLMQALYANLKTQAGYNGSDV